MTFLTHSHTEQAVLQRRPRPLIRILDTAQRLHDAWTRRKTLRALEGLPFEMRKDIGWPTSEQPCNPHRPS